MLIRKLALLGTLLVASLSAQAVFMEQDLVVAGDALITFDSNTDLEWLDLTVTTGQSINDVLGGPLVAAGWRYAQRNEVETLMLNFGADLTLFIPGNWEPARLFGSFLGITDQFSASEWKTWGYHGLNEPDPSEAYIGSVYRRTTFSQGANFGVDGGPATYDRTDGTFGSFLVRSTAIPEPSTIVLMVLGLTGLGYRRIKA